MQFSGERMVFSVYMLEQSDMYMQNNEFQSIPCTLYNSLLKTDHRQK